MANIPPSNSTIRWVKVRFRRVKNRDYYLDAHDYGRTSFKKPPFRVVFLYLIQMVV